MLARPSWYRLLGGVALAGILSPLFGAREANWLKVETPSFTVISALRERETVAWAGEFSQFVAALQRFITIDPRRLSPLTVVIFSRDRDFNPYRMLGLKGKPVEVAGFFSRRETWAVAGLASAESQEDMRRVIFHEGVHWFLSAFNRANPVWVEEGVAEVFSTFMVERKNLQWGQAIPEHILLLRDQKPMPLERLMFVDRSFLSHGSQVAGLLYAQSWAFAHYLTFGQHDLSRTVLTDYLKLCHAAIHPDEAFQQAFGGTYEELDRKLQKYVSGGSYFVAKPPLPEISPPSVAPASPIEVQLALARLALASHRHPLARQHAEKAVALLPDDPRGYEMLGMALDEAGEEGPALAAYREAAARKSKDFQPYFRQGLALQTTAEGQLSAEVAAAAARLYQQAINRHPYYLASYQNLAGLVGFLEGPTDHLSPFLEQGRQLFPSDGMVPLGLALLEKKSGNDEAADALLNGVLQTADRQESWIRDYAAKLEEHWRHDRLLTEIQQRAEQRDYAGALVLVERALDAGNNVKILTELQTRRQDLRSAIRMTEAQAALNARNWPEARRILEEVIGSDASLSSKVTARRWLTELERRALRPTKTR